MSSSTISRSFSRFFSSARRTRPTTIATSRKSTLINFSLSDSESDSDTTTTINNNNVLTQQNNKPAKPKLPPPYNPFNKTANPTNGNQELKDPKNLQEIFHNMRKDGLMQNAVKMFDGLTKDGLTHEALQLFGEIKDKGEIPDVISHTAVIETYMNAGEIKQGLKIYLSMLSSGILPNAYTYSVLIKGLANGNNACGRNGGNNKFIGDARKYLVEMVEKGMRPNGEICVAVIESFLREERGDEAREMVMEMKKKGFVGDETSVRDALVGKNGHVFRFVTDVFFGK